MTYDVMNNLLTITDPLNRKTTFTYDPMDNLASVTDALGRVTTYQYDERGLLFKATDANQPTAGVTTYSYTVNGLLAKIVDAKGSQTAYTYDKYDRLMTELLPVNSSYQYAYDKNSNVTQVTRPDGKLIQYTYDALNRRTSTVYPAATANNVTYSYDLGSRLTQMVTTAATNRWTYDKLDRALTDVQIVGGKTYTTTYAYDKAGNRTRALYPSGKDMRATFDANNRLLTLGTFNSSNSTTTALAAYSYDLLGRPGQRDLTDGGAVKRSTYAYDLANQLLSVTNQIPSGALFSKFTYTYDAVSNRLTQTAQTATGTKTLNFGYNRLYELISTSGALAQTYTYDLVGNRTLANGVTYGMNAAHQYTTVGSLTQTHDANGNLTADGSATYGYDEEGRLSTVTKGGVTTTYKYDGLDRRISKTVGTTTTYFIYDGDEIVEERNSSGAVNASYVYGEGLDEVLMMARGGSNKYYFQDGLGSVASVTNAAGSILERYEYDPYGKPTMFNASNATITTSAIGNPILFTGRWLDSESGLYDYRARAYSSSTGRFLQRDPIGYEDGMNLYSYVGNSPNNFIDPYGLQAGSIYGRISTNLSGGISLPLPTNMGGIPINIPPFNPSQNGIGNGGFLPGTIGPMSPCKNGFDFNQNGFYSQSAGGGRIGKKDHRKPTISQIKKALKEAHSKIGGKIAKGDKDKGKYKSPQRGDQNKGYRLDPPDMHGHDWHINIWDYTQGKRKSGKGYKEHIPIE